MVFSFVRLIMNLQDPAYKVLKECKSRVVQAIPVNILLDDLIHVAIGLYAFGSCKLVCYKKFCSIVIILNTQI